jgi:hypothetical protein
MALYVGSLRPYDSSMINQPINPSMVLQSPIAFTYDVASDSPIFAIMETAKIADVDLWALRRIEDAPNGCAQIEVGFYTNEDAIAFTAVYLDEEPDSVYVAEYLGFDWKETLAA